LARFKLDNSIISSSTADEIKRLAALILAERQLSTALKMSAITHLNMSNK
jgi:hypothetical protein